MFVLSVADNLRKIVELSRYLVLRTSNELFPIRTCEAPERLEYEF